MDADLDLLLITVFVTADDLLPERQNHAARSVTDAEVVTLCVAQASSGSRPIGDFSRSRANASATRSPSCLSRPGTRDRRRRLADALEWLMGIFAGHGPGFHDDLLVIDSTPVRRARSRETAQRSALGDAADYGWSASRSRYFWGFRLHAISAADGTPRALALTSPKPDEREIGLILPDRCQRRGGEVLLADGGHASRGFAAPVAAPDATLTRPGRTQQPGTRPHLAPIRQRIESSFRPAKTSSPPNATAPAPSPPQRTRPRPLLLPRSSDHPQPPTRTQQPCTRQPPRLTARNQPSSAPGVRNWTAFERPPAALRFVLGSSRSACYATDPASSRSIPRRPLSVPPNF
jgi:hypothetical protein